MKDIGEPASPAFDPTKEDDIEVKAFLEFREHGKISLKYAIPLGLKALLTDIPFAALNHWPGPVGMKLRQLFYRYKFGSMGANVADRTRNRHPATRSYRRFRLRLH